ncbi:MAG: type VI secretion system lipoprotein TssJ [Spiribacter salinus]|uniref:Type VI secretion system lipoprotein TssJ n=1 Tax=Spiribacter salinus TaxID=1335746 RepID=A0A540VTL0_9GAMM|nr:MAG: type VI secretion system lipoprotein TssJ [Spiribacter salinus]
MRALRHILLLAGAFLLVACAQEPEPPMPVNKTLSVQAGPNVNQYNNAANPIVVRLYQLSSRSEFEAADFWDIFNDNGPDLAGVVLDKRSLSPLYPGETRLVAFDLEPEVFYLGAFAEFADFGTQQFRAAVPIDAERLDNGVTISVTSSGVSIQFRNPVDATEEGEDETKGFGLLAWLFGGGE